MTYISTAIPYVNARPHIGFALEIVLTDALARAYRQRGKDVFFLTGTDENSLKNVQAAERAGVATRVLVDHNAAAFRDLRNVLGLSFDDFIRTSADPRHAPGVWNLWAACEQSGDIYKKPYRGLYCVGCEQFYSEDELTPEGFCPEHLREPEFVEEENYFFRLSRYKDQLEGLIVSDQILIHPVSRKNEVLSFIRQGLHDFSISRSRSRARGWGIPVPGDPDQVIYVWFDALVNYLTALGYHEHGPLYEKYWIQDPARIHVIGKGVLRFHAVYWPAMLLSAGIPLPSTIFVHGYITVNGQKMSKTLGNVLEPAPLVQQYGVDPLRYYLLREVPATEDGDFHAERFVRAYNAELADQLGNVLNRVVRMIARYYDGSVPAAAEQNEVDLSLLAIASGLGARVDDAVEGLDPQAALDAIWQVVGAANKYVVVVEPWTLARQRGAAGAEGARAERRLATVLYNLAEVLRLVAHALAPFLPSTALAIREQLGLPVDADGKWAVEMTWGGYKPGTRIQPGAVLFPKLEAPEQT